MLMGKKCCATDVLNRFTINFFSIISGPILEVIVKEAIVESVQIFEHLNKLPSKPPLYEANEFQVLEPLLVAMVSNSGIIFVAFLCTFVILSMSLHIYRCGDQNWTAYSRWGRTRYL